VTRFREQDEGVIVLRDGMNVAVLEEI